MTVSVLVSSLQSVVGCAAVEAATIPDEMLLPIDAVLYRRFNCLYKTA
jgi:hypothetical protein